MKRFCQFLDCSSLGIVKIDDETNMDNPRNTGRKGKTSGTSVSVLVLNIYLAMVNLHQEP